MFTLLRVTYLRTWNISTGSGRHAFKGSQKLIIALSDSFDVALHDGEKEMLPQQVCRTTIYMCQA